MSFSSVAEYSRTAIVTRPNETAPFQIARIPAAYPLCGGYTDRPV